jgi:hypothetical protein
LGWLAAEESSGDFSCLPVSEDAMGTEGDEEGMAGVGIGVEGKREREGWGYPLLG